MLGNPVSLELKNQGYQVVIFTRNASEARIKMPTHFELFEGDISDPYCLELALKDCFGVHINLNGAPSLQDIEKTEFIGAITFNDMLKYASRLSEYFIHTGEQDSDEEIVKLLGKPQPNLTDWLKH